MPDGKLGAVEARFADLVWENAPIASRELARLCEEASAKLDMLTDVSTSTLEDMKKIEESRGNICGEIDNMICETINTDSYTLIQSPAAEDDEKTEE